MNNKLIEYINNSYLSELLKVKTITDISFNGENLFYQDNVLGRKKSDILLTKEQASSFIRQIANLSEKQFSVSEPSLDVFVGNYRIHAIHSSLGRFNGEKTVTFDIRIASSEIRLDENFFDKKSLSILMDAIACHKSIIIAGSTGSGKTELQKFLISKFKENERAIIIDCVEELDSLKNYNNIDLTYWQADQYSQRITINELIRNALRANPDWIVISEARGGEMREVLSSVMTGHPILTTIHSKSLISIPHRVAQMVGMSDSKQSFDSVLSDVLYHFDVFVYVEKRIDKTGKIVREITQIGESNETKLKVIYERAKK